MIKISLVEICLYYILYNFSLILTFWKEMETRNISHLVGIHVCIQTKAKLFQEATFFIINFSDFTYLKEMYRSKMVMEYSAG